MKMSHADALKILSLSSSAEFEDIKKAYRRASMQYHPDRNPAGLEMMKLVNAAWACLSDFVPGSEKDQFDASQYGEDLNNALNAIIDLGFDIEICGSWVWVSGDTRPHRETLKAAGFKWAPKKMMWHFRPAEWRSFSRGQWDMEKIRERHGSVTLKNKQNQRLTA